MKQKEQKPRLRFRGQFGKHRKSRLGEIAELKNGYAFKSSSYNEQGTWNVLTISNVGGEMFIKEEFQSKIVQLPENLSKHHFLKEEDILVSLTGNVGRVSMNKGYRNLLNQRVGLIEINDRDADKNYIFHYLRQGRFEQQMINHGQGAAQLNISKSEVESFILFLPSLPEQQKIAAFFTAIDRRIALQQERVDLLEKRKKGLVQRVFKKEIRFRDEDGETFPEWETVKLGKVGQTYGGLSRKTKEDFGRGTGHFVTYRNVFNNVIAIETETDRVQINEAENQNQVRKGDILFTASSETLHEVAMASLWNSITSPHLNSFCFGYRINEKINPTFMVYYLRSPLGRKDISILAQGSTRYNVPKTKLMQVLVPNPSINEQKKIAAFLSALDREIKSEKDKLEQLRQQKQGFLQQMFV